MRFDTQAEDAKRNLALFSKNTSEALAWLHIRNNYSRLMRSLFPNGKDHGSEDENKTARGKRVTKSV